MKDDTHLDENAIAMSLVDEGQLSPAQRAHLTACGRCSEERERTMRALTQMGRMAAHIAPEPVRKLLLPASAAGQGFQWSKLTRPVLGTALVAIAVLVVMRHVPTSVIPDGPNETVTDVSVLSAQTESEDSLMAQIGALINNALPPAYHGITGVVDPFFEDGDLTDFVVPAAHGTDDISIHIKDKEMLPC